jgi:hypothetical protein
MRQRKHHNGKMKTQLLTSSVVLCENSTRSFQLAFLPQEKIDYICRALMKWGSSNCSSNRMTTAQESARKKWVMFHSAPSNNIFWAAAFSAADSCQPPDWSRDVLSSVTCTPHSAKREMRQSGSKETELVHPYTKNARENKAAASSAWCIGVHVYTNSTESSMAATQPKAKTGSSKWYFTNTDTVFHSLYWVS